MKVGIKIGLVWALVSLSLMFLLTGCPAEVIDMNEAGMDASPDYMIADVRDASPDLIMREAGEGGYNFDLWTPSNGTIEYHGGPVMAEPATVHLIWYGNWENNTTVSIVKDLIVGLNESDYLNINTAYYGLFPAQTIDGTGAGNKISSSTNQLTLGKSIFVGYSHGTSLTDDDIFTIVREAIDSQQTEADERAIYLVLTSGDVAQGGVFGGFCSRYCGWHSWEMYGKMMLKYSFIGDPAKCLDGCTPKRRYNEYGFTHSPNLNWSADGMCSVIGHELSEAITDPIYDVQPAWMDKDGWENMDKCSWTYSKNIYLTANGSAANIKLGERDYLLQQNWVLFADGGQGCGMRP
jgi:hypothetical protein